MLEGAMVTNRKRSPIQTLNLLYISSKKKWGGVSSWMEKTALGLKKRGHHILIVAHPNGRFMKSAHKELNLLPLKLGMDYNPISILYLYYQIKVHKIDIVVTNIEKEVAIGGIAARLARVPNIRRVGNETDFNQRWKVKLHHRLFVNHCIVPCNLIRDNALKRAPWLEPDQFVTIYNGRNSHIFSAEQIKFQRQKWGINSNSYVIGSTSRLSSGKGIEGLIRVFSRITRYHPNTRLVITGEGQLKNDLVNQAINLGVRDKVIFAGFSSDPLKTAAAYDIAVCNSFFEGFPNSVVEYFAVGCPVVTTDAGGVAEMARHEYNALLIPCNGDDEKLFYSLNRLIESPHLRSRLGENAARTIADGFSEEVMLDRLEKFYQSCVDKCMK
jgi:glycosyltransferase involved in cell wall biosynthesis